MWIWHHIFSSQNNLMFFPTKIFGYFFIWQLYIFFYLAQSEEALSFSACYKRKSFFTTLSFTKITKETYFIISNFFDLLIWNLNM